MKNLIIGISFLLFLLGSSAASGESTFVTLQEDIRLPLPEGWSLADSGGGFPYRLTPESPGTEMLIYRSDVAPEDAVSSEAELKASVYDVVDNVILALPQARLFSNSGYYEQGRCSFVVEFSTDDSTSGIARRHRFVGLIYRLPTGQQVLFTLWGKSPPNIYREVETDLKLMQSGFSYSGPHATDVFAAGEGRSDWQMAAPLLLLLGILLFLSFRRYRLRPKVSRPQLWRCICGTWNSAEDDTCRRCNHPKHPVTVR